MNYLQPISTVTMALIAISILVYINWENKATEECQKKHPHSKVLVIEDVCHYSTEYGWIVSGKSVINPKNIRIEKTPMAF